LPLLLVLIDIVEPLLDKLGLLWLIVLPGEEFIFPIEERWRTILF